MKNQILKIFTLSFVCLLAGCSTISRKYDDVRAQRIKKVAVLSFEILQEQPKDALGFGKLGELKEGRIGDSKVMQDMATSVYNQFNNELQKRSGWKVVSLQELMNNKEYQKQIQEARSGVRSMSLTGDNNTAQINAPAVMSQIEYRKLSHAQKASFAKALGADAFAEYMVVETIKQGWSLKHITGNAPFSFLGRSNFIVHTADSEEPVWQIQNIDGKDPVSSETLPEEVQKIDRLAMIGEKAALESGRELLSLYGKK